jgi:hypothetical protein
MSLAQETVLVDATPFDLVMLATLKALGTDPKL